MDPEAAVTGYWSDGSANVEVKAYLRNEGDLRMDRPVEIAVTCHHNGESIGGCGQRTSVSLPDGYGPARDAFTLRVPPGKLSLEFVYGEDGGTTVDVDVPARIVGVDRDVWECFSDTADRLGQTPLELTGCAAWSSAEFPIQKWDQNSSVKVWASGPESYIEVFKNVLDELGPVLGLVFEWVSTQGEAEFVADIGYTLEQGSYYAHPHEAGAATVSVSDTGEITSSKISIRDRWGESTFHDLSESSQKFLVGVITHESIHTLTSMNHRTEPDSIMNNESLRRQKMSPMDERLLQLHGHQLVKPGMAMSEIEALIVFNDELIDPQIDAQLYKWKLVTNAYHVLRQAEAATFRIKSSECNEKLGWADYTVFDLESETFAWVGLDDGSDRFYVYEGQGGTHEYWRQARGGWSKVSSQLYGDATPGWISHLSDPHSMIENVLRYADWAEVRFVIGPDGLARLEFELDHFRTERLQIAIVLDPETGVISQYSMDWKWRGGECEIYRVEADNGQYHSTFEFPDPLREGSAVLGDCRTEQVLGPITGARSLSGTWRRHCGSGTEGYSRSYRFSVDDWSYVRIEVSSASSTSIHLLRDSGSEELNMDQTGRSVLSITRGWIWDQRAQAIVPPGEYAVKVVTQDRLLNEFGLAIHTSETGPPPHSFQSIGSGKEHVCVLDSDGLAVCWGSNGELFAWPPHGDISILPPSSETFIAISSGAFYSCGLKADGTPLCWGRDFSDQTSPPAGERFVSVSSGVEHTCALRSDGTPVCWGSNYLGESSPPTGEKLVSISCGTLHTCALRLDGTPVCWGSNYIGETLPPTGEQFVSISSGGQHTCALRQDGSPVCWGSNLDGKSSPPAGEKFVSISSGGQHTCALRSDGTAVCWGDNGEGQISLPTGEKFVSISSGGFHTCALRSDGTPVCWGGYSSREPSSPFP